MHSYMYEVSYMHTRVTQTFFFLVSCPAVCAPEVAVAAY